MITDYQSGYARGYNAGQRRGFRLMKPLLAAAKAIRERARRAEAGIGIGHCVDCQHWKRGGSNCLWGYCSQPHDWPRACLWTQPPEAKVVTTEDFGCVNFAPREGELSEGER